MAEVVIKASDAPAKINHLFTSLSEAKSIVASCVLSPSSAMKTVMKIVMKSLYCTLGMDCWINGLME